MSDSTDDRAPSENGAPRNGAQRKKSEQTPLTTADGAPIADNQNALTAGERGPVLRRTRDNGLRYTWGGRSCPILRRGFG